MKQRVNKNCFDCPDSYGKLSKILLVNPDNLMFDILCHKLDKIVAKNIKLSDKPPKCKRKK